MNMSTLYENKHEVSKEHEQRFYDRQKKKLSTLEHIGLEAILCEFVKQYEQESLGFSGDECCELINYTRWNEDSVDILDGVYDTYVFDNYAIGTIWAAYESCIMLTCFKLEHKDYDDPYDILQNVDWLNECESVLFRLD